MLLVVGEVIEEYDTELLWLVFRSIILVVYKE